MAGFVCRYMLVFVGWRCISVNLSEPHDKTIDICKQPYGRKMCLSLCKNIGGCSSIEYLYDSLYCHVTSGPTPAWTDDKATSGGESCPQNSLNITTRKGHSVCVVNKESDLHSFQMTGSGPYHLGDYNIEVIGRTSLLMRLNASRKIQVTFWHERTDGKQKVQVIMGEDKTLLMRLFFKEGQGYQREEFPVQLMEPFWKTSGFTELWFQWNNGGFLALGKGSILGRNELMKLQVKTILPFSKETLKKMVISKGRLDNETITVEVKHGN